VKYLIKFPTHKTQLLAVLHTAEKFMKTDELEQQSVQVDIASRVVY